MDTSAPNPSLAQDLQDLAELSALALQIARAHAARALHQATGGLAEGEQDATLAFSRAARVFRQSCALKSRLLAPARRLAATGPHAVLRQRLLRAIPPDAPDPESLRDQIDERLSDPELDLELARHSVEKLFARLATELDLPLDVTQLDDEVIDYVLSVLPGGLDPLTPEEEEAAETDPFPCLQPLPPQHHPP